MDVSLFKSTGDSVLISALWSRDWAVTLSSSPLKLNKAYTKGQLSDLSDKLEILKDAVGFKNCSEGSDKPPQVKLTDLVKDG